jgi:hypothetical protein
MITSDKLLRFLFAAVVLTIPLQKFFNISFIPFGNGPFVYFSLLALLISIFCLRDSENAFQKFALKYFALYILVLTISLLIGFLTFDYPKLYITAIGLNVQRFIEYIYSFGINISIDNFSKIVVAYKAIIKDGIILGIFTFGTSFWIVKFFRNQWHDAFKIFSKCCIVIFSVCVVYSFVEFFYLKGYAWATYMLMDINPLLYNIDFTASVTWPPLLWGNRMRSIFLEPSYCAIFLTSVIPMFLMYFLNLEKIKNKIIFYVIFTLLMFIIFATNSKTAMVLILFLCTYILFIGFLWRKTLLKRSFILIACVLIGCTGYFSLLRAAYIIPAENPVVQWNIIKDIEKKMNIQYNEFPSQQYKEINITEEKAKEKIITNNNVVDSYVNKNLSNLTDVNYGSNSSRYGVTFAELGVFLNNPILGTGSSELLQPYIYEHLPDFSDNEEVRRWTKFNWEHGIMTFQMPLLNDFSNKLAKNGIVGFITFYFPFIYFLLRIFRKREKLSLVDKQYIIALLAAFGCIFIGCMAGPLNLFFTYWVLLGILGAAAFSDYEKNAE